MKYETKVGSLELLFALHTWVTGHPYALGKGEQGKQPAADVLETMVKNGLLSIDENNQHSRGPALACFIGGLLRVQMPVQSWKLPGDNEDEILAVEDWISADRKTQRAALPESVRAGLASTGGGVEGGGGGTGPREIKCGGGGDGPRDMPQPSIRFRGALPTFSRGIERAVIAGSEKPSGVKRDADRDDTKEKACRLKLARDKAKRRQKRGRK